jgi:hypothetical protein
MKFKLYFPTYGIIGAFIFLTYMYFTGNFAQVKLVKMDVKSTSLNFSYPLLEAKGNLIPLALIANNKKPTLMYVFLPLCGSCEQQIKFLATHKDEYNFIGLMAGDILGSKEWLAGFANPFGDKIGKAEKAGQLLTELKINEVPILLLIDRAGIIKYSYGGLITSSSWEKIIQPKIAEINI